MIASRNAGFSLIEILVTIVILMVGLLGLAGLQGRALTSQLESYQRSQALILLKDMANRISANRSNASLYVATLGTDVTACPAVGNAVATSDLCEWHNSLMGAAEVQSGGGNVGAMIGARGCVYETVVPASGVPAQYLVAIAWQGMNRTAAPAVNCGVGSYGDDTLRRVVTLPISIADMN
ncbi:MAG: type IV pilus modification protein PilV [Rhodocyclaceae bacterium]|nr:type IV pilus modification protein PilV [Rhodocyclaceae bacterium]